jgi:hypothetical protein
MDILHVEDRNDDQQYLPPNETTTVLTCPSITAPEGAIVQITAMVQYLDNGSLDPTKVVRIELNQDDVFLVYSSTAASGTPVGDDTFDLKANLPLVWELTGDGLPHVYTVTVLAPDGSSDTQLAGPRAIFINAIVP